MSASEQDILNGLLWNGSFSKTLATDIFQAFYFQNDKDSDQET